MGGVRFLISALISKQISGCRFQLISTDFTTQCTRFLLLPAPRLPHALVKSQFVLMFDYLYNYTIQLAPKPMIPRDHYPIASHLVMGDTDTKVSILPIPVSVLSVSIIRCHTAAKRYDTSYVMYLEHVVLTLQ